MESSTLDERIIRLETRIAYQDHLLSTLDEVMQQFTSRVERLERKLDTLQQSVAPARETGPANDPPPHY